MSICVVSPSPLAVAGPRCSHSTSSADVSDTVQLRAALDRLHARLGRVDGCVTAAGICIDKPFGEHTSQDFYRQLAVNVSRTDVSSLLSARPHH